MVNLTPTEEKILLILAKQEPKTYYDFWKHEKVASSNTTVLKALKRLQDRKLIKVGRKKESSAPGPRGRKKKLYVLTHVGLLRALTLEEAWEHINKIANKQADKFPLIFGKWNFFKKKEIQDRIIERLNKAIVKNSWRINAFEQIIQKKPEEDILKYRELFKAMSKGRTQADTYMADWVKVLKQFDESLLPIIDPNHEIINAVLGLTLPFVSSEELTEFMSIFKEDKELNEYIHNEMIEIENRYVLYLKNIRSWKSWWEQS